MLSPSCHTPTPLSKTSKVAADDTNKYEFLKDLSNPRLKRLLMENLYTKELKSISTEASCPNILLGSLPTWTEFGRWMERGTVKRSSGLHEILNRVSFSPRVYFFEASRIS